MENSRSKKDRGELMEELHFVREQFKADPHNENTRLGFAQLLFHAGFFAEAKETLEPFFAAGESPLEAAQLMSKLLYLLGDYARCEAFCKQILSRQNLEASDSMKTRTQLLFTYYQSNQFEKSGSLFKKEENPPAATLWEHLSAFGDQKPYQINWGKQTRVEIPFLYTDPLPVVQLEIDGETVNCFIDTGGADVILDDQVAARLGIKPDSQQVSSFGGGMKAKVEFGRARQLNIGGLTIRNLPVMILPTQRWSDALTGGKHIIGGCVPTQLLKQFLGTLDYPNHKLILHQRSEKGKQLFESEIKGKSATKIPFVLQSTHYMMAKGSLNDRQDLTFFVDSGLASEASFTAPIQTLKYAGIPVPETKIDENSEGGGGGAWASGTFEIKKLGLGPLIQENVKGEYGARPPESYWENGFIVDGLISHNFLRQFAWTIDFDAMQMIFVK
jgi:hypothetical protein